MIEKTLNDLSILVVEDDIETLSLLDIFLKDKFKNVFTALDYNDALEKFEKNSIDIIITDINLPVKSGIDLSKVIREKDNSIPIILVTASDNKELILDALHLGVNHYLFKPVVYSEFSSLLEEISKKVLSRKKLEHKNTLLLNAIEHSSDIIAIIDTDFTIEYINPKFEKTLGYSINDIDKMNLEDIISFEKQDKKFYADLVSHIRSKRLFKGNSYLKNSNNKDILFDMTITPSIDNTGNITNYTLNAESIDEITEVKKELKEKTSLYLAQATNAATDEMMKRISHHWRQPLAVVSTTLQNIQLGTELNNLDNETINKSVNNAMIEIDKLSKTIDFFYDKYQNKNGKNDINLDSFVKQTFGFIQEYLIKSDIRFEFDLDANEDLYICEKNVFDMFTTIVDNAKEEFEQTGQKDKYIKVTTKIIDDYAIIEIFNNGRIIDEDIKHRIFEPYFSTKHVKSGSGLGLYISKEIAEKICNGNFYFENKENGVSFYIQIPKKGKYN